MEHTIIKKVWVAANITYGGFTYNTKLLVEICTQGIEYHIGKKFTTDFRIMQDWVISGKKVRVKAETYYTGRLAIPDLWGDFSKDDIWYINNERDTYKVNKLSKAALKLFKQYNITAI